MELLQALHSGNSATALKLIQSGIDLTTLPNKESFLFLAHEHGLNEVFDSLLDRNANVNEILKDNNTILHRMIVSNPRMIEQTLRCVNLTDDLNRKDALQRTYLIIACLTGFEEVVDALLAKGVSLDDQDDLGTTALIASLQNNIHMKLLDAGANIHLCNKSFDTPLSVAVLRDFTPLAKRLLEMKADVNIRTEYGTLPLHNAAFNGNLELLKLLIEQKADINAPDGNTKTTALMTALLHCNYECASYLLDLKADVDAVNLGKESPLLMLCKSYLFCDKLDRSPHIQSMIAIASRLRNDINKETALSLAIEKDFPEMVSLLSS